MSNPHGEGSIEVNTTGISRLRVDKFYGIREKIGMNPKRIISLAPTHTETLFFLGLGAKVIGVTENCDYPTDAKTKETFGSWAYPDITGVLRERPDLVCTFSSHQEEIATLLSEKGINVFHSDPPDVQSAFHDIVSLANITKANDAQTSIQALFVRLESVQERLQNIMSKPKVLRILNWDPLITVGKAAFQADVIRQAGGVNITDHYDEPYVCINLEEALTLDPEVVFFCEPGLKQKIKSSPGWRKTEAVQQERVFCFPCGLTCRSGPRIIDMVEQLAKRLHPELFNQSGHMA